MKLLLFSGFAGSGKTSTILSLLNYLGRFRENAKVVIIENEVGAVGIDDKILQSQGYEVKGLYSGCVCCSLVGTLMDTLKEAEAQFAPEYVVFEPTGLAYPDQIKAQMHICPVPIEWIKTLTVVDAQRYRKLKRAIPGLIAAQITAGDVHFINKKDTVTDEQLEDIIADVKATASGVPAYQICASRQIDDSVWEEVLGHG